MKEIATTITGEQLCSVYLTRKEILGLPLELRSKIIERSIDQMNYEDLQKLMD